MYAFLRVVCSAKQAVLLGLCWGVMGGRLERNNIDFSLIKANLGTPYKTGLKCFVVKHYGDKDPAVKLNKQEMCHFSSSLQRHSTLSEENSYVMRIFPSNG